MVLNTVAVLTSLNRDSNFGSVIFAGGYQGLGPVRERSLGHGKLIWGYLCSTIR